MIGNDGGSINDANEARGMAALRRDLNLEGGRFRLRFALREVVARLERDVKSINLVQFGSFAMAKQALGGRVLPGAMSEDALLEVYEALSGLMTDVVKHNLLDPSDLVYLTAMDALAACEEG